MISSYESFKTNGAIVSLCVTNIPIYRPREKRKRKISCDPMPSALPKTEKRDGAVATLMLCANSAQICLQICKYASDWGEGGLSRLFAALTLFPRRRPRPRTHRRPRDTCANRRWNTSGRGTYERRESVEARFRNSYSCLDYPLSDGQQVKSLVPFTG